MAGFGEGGSLEAGEITRGDGTADFAAEALESAATDGTCFWELAAHAHDEDGEGGEFDLEFEVFGHGVGFRRGFGRNRR